MKRYHRVLLWVGILLVPLLLQAIVPNLALNIVNTIGARMLLTSAQLRDALSAKDPPAEAAPAMTSTFLRIMNVVHDSATPAVANGEDTATAAPALHPPR